MHVLLRVIDFRLLHATTIIHNDTTMLHNNSTILHNNTTIIYNHTFICFSHRHSCSPTLILRAFSPRPCPPVLFGPQRWPRPPGPPSGRGTHPSGRGRGAGAQPLRKVEALRTPLSASGLPLRPSSLGRPREGPRRHGRSLERWGPIAHPL